MAGASATIDKSLPDFDQIYATIAGPGISTSEHPQVARSDRYHLRHDVKSVVYKSVKLVEKRKLTLGIVLLIKVI
jgi:hypothetical protein